MKSVADVLVKNGIVRTNFENPFTWTSGIRSPIYCDCRELISLVEAREHILESFVQVVEREHPDSYDMIAGTATAGIPWASFLADKLKKPLLYVRSEAKGHGGKKMVEGRVDIENPKIIIIEDAISTGGSAINSAQILRSESQAQVDFVFAIFSWSSQIAETKSQSANVKLHALTHFQAIADSLLENQCITDSELEALKDFQKDPTSWYDKRSL